MRNTAKVPTEDAPTVDAYPLAWPVGRPRTPLHERKPALFRRETDGMRRRLSVEEAMHRVRCELDMFDAVDIVISTNAPPTRNGIPSVSRQRDDDPGVAVYFKLARGTTYALHCLACDRWDRLADNLAAIAADLDATRAKIRYGVTDQAQAFAGHLALPAMDARKPWWQVLGFKDKPKSRAEVEEKRRRLLLQYHPDRHGGGSHAASNQAAEINAAWDEAQLELPL